MAVQMVVRMVERMAGRMVERMAGRMVEHMVERMVERKEVDPVTLAPLNGTSTIWQ